MRTYELVLVFDPSLEVEQIEVDLQKLNEYFSQNGLPRRWERWGKRRLSYEIKGRQYGYYVLAIFDLHPSRSGELDRSVRLSTSVLRHLITAVDAERVPEVDEDSVRTLGAGVAPPPEGTEGEGEAVSETEAAIDEDAADSSEGGETSVS